MKKVFAILLTLILLDGCASKPGVSSTGGESLYAVESASQSQSELSEPPPIVETSSLEIIADLSVDDSLTISGRGCAVVGDVNSGEFAVGDMITILHDNQPIAQTTILNILVGTKESQIAQTGNNVSLLLDGIERSLLTKGDKVVKYGSSESSLPQDDSGAKTVYTVEELQGFFTQLEEYARTGDIRLLDHLNFKDEKNYAGMKAMLEDETARELWCAAYAPTVWSLPKLERDVDFTKTSSLSFSMKSPWWMFVSEFHTALSGCAPLSDDPAAIKSYFEKYSEQIPYHYYGLGIKLVDGKLKMDGERFVSWYVAVQGGDDVISKAVDDPLKPFVDLIDKSEFTTKLPEMNEKEKLLSDYYKLVADNRFFEAIELVEGTDVAMSNRSTLNELAVLTDEQKGPTADGT